MKLVRAKVLAMTSGAKHEGPAMAARRYTGPRLW